MWLFQDGEYIEVPRFENEYSVSQTSLTIGRLWYTIEEHQYEALRKIFFGNIEPDYEYLKRNFN